jgi:hypothetical protein
MKFLRANKSAFVSAIFMMLFGVLYVIIKFFPPSGIISKISGITFNDTSRVDSVFYKYTFLLILLSACILFLLWFMQSTYLEKFSGMAIKMLTGFSGIFTINTLLVISLLYVTVLFSAAVYYYDLGFDEAWYITFARNFSIKAIPFYTANERIAVIDTISMLPYYLLSIINFKFGLLEVWHFKTLSVLLSVFTLIVLFRVSNILYGKAAAVLFLFFLIIQPGFGFIASSYFGEFLQAAFMFYGLYYWLKGKDITSSKPLLMTSLMFSIAIHTKFQLVIILATVLIIMAFTDKDKQSLKLLVYTIMFTVLLSLIRTIPVLLTAPASVRSLALITDLLAAKQTTVSASLILERLQLFNRFFPLAALVIVSGLFSLQMKNAFERFILFFTIITAFWWIFIYPLSTYRNPFMAVITICLMASIMISRLYDSFYQKNPARLILLRYVSGISIILLMLYGFSANLVYARIGYNDGVQFDLDGFRSRLFSPVIHDNTQKDFHSELRKVITTADTLYNGSFVTRFYVPNTIFTIEKMIESLNNTPLGTEKLLLVTRDVYPLGFDKIYSQIDSLVLAGNLKKRIILKTGSHELYGLKK